MPPRSLSCLALLALTVSLVGCAPEFPEGTPLNPIRVFFVTSNEVDAVRDSSDEVIKFLEAETGLEFEAVVSSGYQTVIEGMGTGDADLAFMPPFAYIKANTANGCQVALTTVRHGETTYRAQFIARVDANINTLEDLDGRVWGYSDSNSTSGFIAPNAMLKSKGIRPRETLNTGNHTNTVQFVYEGKCDFGTTYWSPEGRDARSRLAPTHPDVYEKVKILAMTVDIPNDTVAFRKAFDPEVQRKITDALLAFSKTAVGKKALDQMYNITGFQEKPDSFYDSLRKMVKGELAAAPKAETLSSSKGQADDPYKLAAPAGEHFPHDAIKLAVSQPEDVQKAIKGGEVDFAVLDLAAACQALADRHNMVAIGEVDGTTTRRLMALGRTSKLTGGLRSIDAGTRAALQLPEGFPAALGEAYARQLGLQKEQLGDAAEADLLITVEPVDYSKAPARPEGFAPLGFSPPFPSRVVIVSRKMPATAMGKLVELVLAKRDAAPYPGVARFHKATKKALGDWPEWLKKEGK